MVRRVRAVGITIKNEKVLLMWRSNRGREYYVFPGGGVEKGETSEEAVVREFIEETSITVEIKKLLYHLRYTRNDRKDSDQLFYLCDYVSGLPKLGNFNEKKNMRGGKNLYRPMWVAVKDIPKMTLYPLEVRDWLSEDVKNNFLKIPREMTIKIEELRNG